MGADDVAKGLRRGDAELAVTALLKVPPEERGAVLPAVGSLFRAAVAETHRRGDFSRCAYWAARAEREPGLCGEGASAEGVACRWALLWGAARSRDFPRARRVWQPARAEAERTAPALSRAVDAFLESEGTALPAGTTWRPPEAPAPDPRLGYERAAPRPALPPPPTSAAAVEPAVLALCARQSWPTFAQTLLAWCAAAPPELAGPLRALGVKLALREQLLRASTAPVDTAPAQVVASLAAGAPPSAADDVLLSLRLLSASAAASPFETEAAARPFCLLAAAAAAQPAHRALVAQLVEGQLFAGAAARAGLRLVQTLLATAPSPALAVKALLLWVLAKGEAGGAEWLTAAFTRLAANPAALGAWLGAAGGKARAEALRVMALVLPVELCERLADALWEGAPEPVQRDLAALVESLMARVQALAFTRQHASTIAGMDPLELSFLLAEFEQSFEGSDLSEPARRLFERHEAKLLRLDSRFLVLALEEAASPAVARRKVDQFLAGRGALGLVEAAAHAANTGWGPLSEELERKLIVDYAKDAGALAEALPAARRLGAPTAVLVRLAAALLEAHGAKPMVGEAGGRALELARQLARPGRRPRKKRAPKARAPKKGPKKPPGKPKQDDIPF